MNREIEKKLLQCRENVRRKNINYKKHEIMVSMHKPSFSSVSAAYCLSCSLNKMLLSAVFVAIRSCNFLRSFNVTSVLWILLSRCWISFSNSCIWLFNDSVLSWSEAMLSRSWMNNTEEVQDFKLVYDLIRISKHRIYLVIHP